MRHEEYSVGTKNKETEKKKNEKLKTRFLNRGCIGLKEYSSSSSSSPSHG